MDLSLAIPFNFFTDKVGIICEKEKRNQNPKLAKTKTQSCTKVFHASPDNLSLSFVKIQHIIIEASKEITTSSNNHGGT